MAIPFFQNSNRVPATLDHVHPFKHDWRSEGENTSDEDSNEEEQEEESKDKTKQRLKRFHRATAIFNNHQKKTRKMTKMNEIVINHQ